jgi:UvrC Ribonuclease H-like domain
MQQFYELRVPPAEINLPVEIEDADTLEAWLSERASTPGGFRAPGPTRCFRGAGLTVFEPFLAFGQILPAEGFLHAQGSLELSSEGDTEVFWRAALGRTFAEGRFGRAWSPMVEVLADRDIGIDPATHWDVLPRCRSHSASDSTSLSTAASESP